MSVDYNFKAQTRFTVLFLSIHIINDQLNRKLRYFATFEMKVKTTQIFYVHFRR